MKNQYGIEPCPFCGTSVVSCEYDGHYIWVECGNSNCKASMMAVRMDNGDADEAKKMWNTRPIEDALRAQLAEAQAEVDRLTVQLEEAGKALSGLGYTPSADDSGSYDSLIPDKYL